MKDLLKKIGLEEKHFEWKKIDVPVVDPGLYNTLGRQLFEFYEKYKIENEDQRQMESISFVLTSFIESRRNSSQTKWKRWMPWKRQA